jgi:hypothetical protein
VFFSVDCALGYYSVDKRQCIACGAGFYLSTGNRDSCDACPVGTNSQKTGLTRQLDCFRKYCFFYCLKRISGKEEGTSTPVFSEIISIGGKNWQIGRKNISARGLGAT